MTREDILAELRALPRQRCVELLCAMCHELLPIWEQYAAEQGEIVYYESIVGTRQVVDLALPRRALAEVDARLSGELVEGGFTGGDFVEPLTAMQDDDLDFGGAAQAAWGAIENLHYLVFDPGPRRNLDESIVWRFAAALRLDDAALTAWWVRTRDAWLIRPPSPALSPKVFDALLRCDFETALLEGRGGLVSAVIFLLDGRPKEAMKMATRTLRADDSDWMRDHLHELAPHAIVADSRRTTFAFHDGTRVAWVELASKTVRILETTAGARPRCLRIHHAGDLWVAYEGGDYTSAVRYTPSGVRTAITHAGARSILALGPAGQLAYADGLVIGEGYNPPKETPTPILGAAFTPYRGTDVATHDGVKVMLRSEHGSRDFVPASPPVWLGMLGVFAVVACRDTVAQHYIIPQLLSAPDDDWIWDQ